MKEEKFDETIQSKVALHGHCISNKTSDKHLSGIVWDSS